MRKIRGGRTELREETEEEGKQVKGKKNEVGELRKINGGEEMKEGLKRGV